MSDPTRYHSQRAWFHTEGAGELAGLKPVWAADPKDQTKGKRQKEANS
jgi:hypothetical protein